MRLSRVLIAGVLVVSPMALAQPERGPGREQDRAPGQRGDQDRGPAGERSDAPLRERLERRLAELQREEQRLRELIRRVDAGESPNEVMAEWGGPQGGGDVDPRRGFGPDGPRRELTPEELDRAEAFVVELVPELAGRMAQVRETDPQGYERWRMMFAPRALDVMESLERDPARGELEREEFRAGTVMLMRLRDLRVAFDAGANSPAFASAKASLREALAAQFDAKLALREHELIGMSDRVDAVRAELDETRAGRDAHLDRVVDQAIGRLTRWRERGDDRGPGRGERPPDRRGRDGG